MDDASIVKDRVVNEWTAGTSGKIRRDRQTTAKMQMSPQKQNQRKMYHSSQTFQVEVKQPSCAWK